MGQPICMLFPGENHFSLSKFAQLPIVLCVGFRGPCGSGGADYQSQRIRGLVVKWCCLVMSEKLITKNYLLFWNRIDIYYVPWSYPPLSHPSNVPPNHTTHLLPSLTSAFSPISASLPLCQHWSVGQQLDIILSQNPRRKIWELGSIRSTVHVSNGR